MNWTNGLSHNHAGWWNLDDIELLSVVIWVEYGEYEEYPSYVVVQPWRRTSLIQQQIMIFVPAYSKDEAVLPC